MIERILAAMFGLILVFLLLSRAAEFNAIVNTVGGFVTKQTQVLQGVGYPGQAVIQGTLKPTTLTGS